VDCRPVSRACNLRRCLYGPAKAAATRIALIVVIRTVLSFALQIEISGRLPWRSLPQGSEPE